MTTCLVRALPLLAELSKVEDKCLDTEANILRHRAAIDRNSAHTSTRTVQKTIQERIPCTQSSDSDKSLGYDLSSKCRSCNGFQSFSGCRGGGACGGYGYLYCNVERAVSEQIVDVNEQMKRLHDEASLDAAALAKLLVTVQAAAAAIESEMDKIAATVNENCAQILPICSQFSFKDECEALLLQLRTTAVTETDYNRRARLTSLVRSLDEIATRTAPNAIVPPKNCHGSDGGGNKLNSCVVIDAAED